MRTRPDNTFGVLWARRLALVVLLLAGAAATSQAELSPALVEAMEAARMRRATEVQRAMLFANNDAINQARLNGWVADAHYQAAQNDFARLNQEFARRAATDSGAGFTVQKSKSRVFSPGTDSDYIVKVVSSDPAGKIREMQLRYNANVNAYLRKTLGQRGIRVRARLDWHNRLDVDFMADPKYVTDAQFREIAKLNNDAYTRRNAAEYERLSRAGGPTSVTPKQFRDYALEMQDFINKKQHKMEQYRRNPRLLANPAERATYHRLMAQEQKYIERIESANRTLRKQERLRLSKPRYPDPHYEVTYNRRGEAVFRHRSPESLAARGARRSPTNYRTTAVGSAVAQNSTQRALRELSESMAEAGARNPRRWASSADDIAHLADRLPPAEKGLLIENVRRRCGNKAAAQVAESMRNRARRTPPPGGASALDKALRNALGVSDDLREMGRLRRAVNQTAGKALGTLERLGNIGTVIEIASAAASMKTYVQCMNKALDPNITDAQADRYFRQAQDAAHSMAVSGGMGVLFTKVPTLGAAYAAWTVGYDGTRYLLTNTSTGRMIDRHAFEYFDRHQKAYESAAATLTEYLGGQSTRMARRGQLNDLAARYIKALKDKRIRLRPGATAAEVLQRIRNGDLWGLDELLEPASQLGPKPEPASEYMAWYNDVGWIHVGTVRQFHSIRARGSETWGGRSKEPLRKIPILGGRRFSSLDEAMQALVREIGASMARRRAPLAFPKVYYVAGDKKLGFEIVRHPAFRTFKQKADAAK